LGASAPQPASPGPGAGTIVGPAGTSASGYYAGQFGAGNLGPQVYAQQGTGTETSPSGAGGGATNTGTTTVLNGVQITTGGIGNGLTTGVIVPGLDPSKTEYYLGILGEANDTARCIADVKGRIWQNTLDERNGFFLSTRRKAAENIVKLEEVLASLNNEMAIYEQAFNSAGFDDHFAVGFPLGLTDDLSRLAGYGGVGFDAALLAYQRGTTVTPATGIDPTDGPIEFVVTAVGPGLVAKGIKSLTMGAVGEFAMAGVGGVKRSIKGLGSFARAKEFGILPYDQLSALTAGKGLQAHHLIEKRFADTLGVSQGKIPSIALTLEEHQAFTNAWRDAIGHIGDLNPITTADATKRQIMDAARRIYRDYPAILHALARL
jgi:hypothetical protein